MVKATPLKRVTPDHAATPTWLVGVAARESPAAAQTLREVLAYVTPLYADHTLPHGEPVFAHVLGAARRVRDKFGAAIAELAEGVLRMNALGAVSRRGTAAQSAGTAEHRAAQWPAGGNHRCCGT